MQMVATDCHLTFQLNVNSLLIDFRMRLQTNELVGKKRTTWNQSFIRDYEKEGKRKEDFI